MYSEVEKAMARQKVSIEVRSPHGRAKTNILYSIRQLYKCSFFFFHLFILGSILSCDSFQQRRGAYPGELYNLVNLFFNIPMLLKLFWLRFQIYTIIPE